MNKPTQQTMTMTWLDTIGFASMIVLLVGALNWGTVALRYAIRDIPDMLAHEDNLTKTELYAYAPVPDLLDTLSASPVLQMVVYWLVFSAGVIYTGIFVYSSMERREVPA